MANSPYLLKLVKLVKLGNLRASEFEGALGQLDQVEQLLRRFSLAARRAVSAAGAYTGAAA